MITTTETGVICGECTERSDRVVRHADVAAIRACWLADQFETAQCEAERIAERAAARDSYGYMW